MAPTLVRVPSRLTPPWTHALTPLQPLASPVQEKLDLSNYLKGSQLLGEYLYHCAEAN